jgi:hypothetical protein
MFLHLQMKVDGVAWYTFQPGFPGEEAPQNEIVPFLEEDLPLLTESRVWSSKVRSIDQELHVPCTSDQ